MSGLDFVRQTLKSLTNAYPQTVTIKSETVTSQFDPVTGSQTVVETLTIVNILE